MPTIRHFLLLFPLAAAAACSGDDLGDATTENVVDTVTIFSLTGTPITSPSGFFINGVSVGAVRTDQSSSFEFAYNNQSDGQRVLLPRAALGITSTTAEPGLQQVSETFDEIRSARSNGYTTEEPVPIGDGQRYMVRSRLSVCGSVPLYAKLEILSLEPQSVTFKVLANRNCGFRGLEPGFPDN
jgi:hypothetical protein